MEQDDEMELFAAMCSHVHQLYNEIHDEHIKMSARMDTFKLELERLSTLGARLIAARTTTIAQPTPQSSNEMVDKSHSNVENETVGGETSSQTMSIVQNVISSTIDQLHKQQVDEEAAATAAEASAIAAATVVENQIESDTTRLDEDEEMPTPAYMSVQNDHEKNNTNCQNDDDDEEDEMTIASLVARMNRENSNESDKENSAPPPPVETNTSSSRDTDQVTASSPILVRSTTPQVIDSLGESESMNENTRKSSEPKRLILRIKKQNGQHLAATIEKDESGNILAEERLKSMMDGLSSTDEEEEEAEEEEDEDDNQVDDMAVFKSLSRYLIILTYFNF